MEILLSFVASFVLTLALMPFFIGYFNKKKIGQTTREEGPLWHEVKTGTPTMGGTVFMLVILVTLLVSSWLTRRLNANVWMILLTFALFGGIGFLDDFISVFKKQNEGLTSKQKFLAQLIFSAVIIAVGYMSGARFAIDLFGWQITAMVLILPFAIAWITGFSNAVNLTDGLDGLAGGLNIIAYSAYFSLAYMLEQFEVALACLIVIGALLAFLFYNKKPAKIFMGDVGSLALGAGLAVISLILNNPWSLLIIGIVFVIETASVIIQVAVFKKTGKRVFKMSPIHHHFEMVGWSESKVVGIFWLVGIIAAILYFAVISL